MFYGYSWREFTLMLNEVFPSEWVRAALVLAFFAVVVVVALFLYLGRTTRKAYFERWTMAWVYYATFLVASIGLEEAPGHEWLVMVKRACIGIAAWYMFCGNLEFIERGRPRRELYMGAVMLLIWAAVAAFVVRDWLWITVPVFVLLAGASIYTGGLYGRYLRRYQGARLLLFGFVLWGLHLLAFPFMGLTQVTQATAYLLSAVLAFFIAMAMMVQVLEEANERTERLVDQFEHGLARCKALEEQVRLSDERYQALFDSTSDATFMVDLESLQIAEANPAAMHLVGETSGPLVGRDFGEICPAIRSPGDSLMDRKKRFDAVFVPGREIRMFRHDGSPVVCEGEARLVQLRGRPVMQVRMHEVTERKRMEQQLRRYEKLSALGQLIAGVAHELNNPLAVIMGYAQLLNKRADVSERTRVELKKILHESERAAKIVRNLLTFARPREPEMVPVQLNQVIQDVVEASAAELKSNQVQVELRLSPQLPRTKADPNQMEQVLTNLISNAVYAMSRQTTPRRLEISTKEYGAFIRITVADNGPGIPAEIQHKIFESFFTTKAPGQGTGLGLAISRAIVEEHHGKIWAQSEPGNGARFFIELPIIPCPDEPTESEAPADREPIREDTAQHHILIVDDEPGIVEVLKEALGAQGYRVDTAANGAIALQKIMREKFDLIISDLRMPDMDGEKLYHTVRRLQPELSSRIVFLTGDTVSQSARAFLEWTGNRWFSKPFQVSELEQVVRNFLREPKLLEVVR